MWTVLGAFVFTGAFLVVGGGEMVRTVLMGLNLGPMAMLLIMASAFFVMGFVMEWVGIIPILVPIFCPILAASRIDPLWSAIVFCMIYKHLF